MTDCVAFMVGVAAAINWHDVAYQSDKPVNPFPVGSKDFSDWEEGFAEAKEHLSDQ